MGVANNIKEQLKKFDNVILREENSIPVNVYLMNIDIFLFYISNTRHECWARANAEGLMSGCLSIATDVDGGNRDQIQHKKNGYLCKTVDDFYKRIVWFFDHKDEMENMGKYARRHALENFSTKRIIKKLEDFLNA
jgi:glycosyltransferase involved in cell wall biosynthesis